MTVGATPASIVNEALAQIAAREFVTGSPPDFDGTPAGLAAGVLYGPAVLTLLREQDWEFALRRVAGNGIPGSPPPGWAGVYYYPDDCVRLRQVLPLYGFLDPNDPTPLRWQVLEFADSPGENIRAIACNITSPALYYTSSNVTEAEFDSMFQESLVRYLASSLAMALGGRPDFSREKLAESGQILSSAAGRDS